MSERITSHQDLRVYQEACDLDFAVFELSQGFPPEEMPALTAPARRAARAIGGAIADAWAKRRDPARFVAALTDADGELQATRHWLGRAGACGYLRETRHRELEASCDGIGRKLGTMIRDAGNFGGRRREGEGGETGGDPAPRPPAAARSPANPPARQDYRNRPGYAGRAGDDRR